MEKCNLEAQALRMTRQVRENFPPGKVGETVKMRVPDVDCGRCDSRNLFAVVVEVDSSKILYRIGSKDVMFKLLYTRNQFSTCAEQIVDITDAPSNDILLRECTRKSSLSAGQFAEIICTRVENLTNCIILNLTAVFVTLNKRR